MSDDFEDEPLTEKLSPLDEYWFNFLKKTCRDMEERCAGDISFDSRGITNDAQIALILSGRKTALFTSYPSYSIDNEILPVSGELYLVLDRGGNPQCVIELESVNIIPFNEVTFEMAEREGQDANIDEWRERTRENLEDEAAVLGFNVTPDIRLVFQTFRVVYK